MKILISFQYLITLSYVMSSAFVLDRLERRANFRSDPRSSVHLVEVFATQLRRFPRLPEVSSTLTTLGGRRANSDGRRAAGMGLRSAHGVINMASLSVIRRWALRNDLSIREISCRTSLSWNANCKGESLLSENPGPSLGRNRQVSIRMMLGRLCQDNI